MDGVQDDDTAKLEEWVEAITRFAQELPGQAERLQIAPNARYRRHRYWCVPVSVTAPDRQTLAAATVAVDAQGDWRWVDSKCRDAAAPSADGLAAATDPTYSTYESFQRFLSS